MSAALPDGIDRGKAYAVVARKIPRTTMPPLGEDVLDLLGGQLVAAAPAGILKRRDRLEMVGIHAGPYGAKVVYDHPLGYRPYMFLVVEPVGAVGLAPNLLVAVTVRTDGPLPNPAPVLVGQVFVRGESKVVADDVTIGLIPAGACLLTAPAMAVAEWDRIIGAQGPTPLGRAPGR